MKFTEQFPDQAPQALSELAPQSVQSNLQVSMNARHPTHPAPSKLVSRNHEVCSELLLGYTQGMAALASDVIIHGYIVVSSRHQAVCMNTCMNHNPPFLRETWQQDLPVPEPKFRSPPAFVSRSWLQILILCSILGERAVTNDILGNGKIKRRQRCSTLLNRRLCDGSKCLCLAEGTGD